MHKAYKPPIWYAPGGSLTAILPRIFEKGFTGFNGREDKKSTGIGLFLCKKILTKLSHTITVTSEVGKGTAVKLCLDTVSLGVE